MHKCLLKSVPLNRKPLDDFRVYFLSVCVAHFPSLQPHLFRMFVLIWVMWATPLLVIHFQLFLIAGWICQRGLTVQNEKGMFDNYSNLPAKSPFIVHKDHLRHKCCQGNSPGCFSFHWEQKMRLKLCVRVFILWLFYFCSLYCLYCNLISCNNMFALHYISLKCVCIEGFALISHEFQNVML